MARRGQFQILGAGFLILLMISVRFMVVREYAPSFRDVSADISLERGELTRSLLSSLAYASNVQGDPNTTFNSAFRVVLDELQANEFGLFLWIASSSASLAWPIQRVNGDGESAAIVLVNVTTSELGSSWLFNGSLQLRQGIIVTQVEHDLPLLGLMHLEIPISLTINGHAARWGASVVDYNGTSYQASLLKNSGNGQYLLEASIPYGGPGPYYLRVETWDVNGIRVIAAFTLIV